MNDPLEVMLATALGIIVMMVAMWVVSLFLRNASVVDIAWGAGFVLVAWIARMVGDGHNGRSTLLTAMVTIWGLRLAGHLWWRSRGAAEDFRYQSMRRRQREHFPLRSLVTVFGLQGLLMFIVSLPVQLAATARYPDIGWIAVVGVVLWGIGFFFETVGDAQLAQFRADTANDGMVLDRGLWRYSRHPNYFGDCCIWWGIFLVTAETGAAWFGLIGPVAMSYLLINVSGVAMLERGLRKRRDGYPEYVARTSMFFPRRPSSVDEDA
ncbi:MAG: steroid 5-alpha reductase family enzyme [Candidatus Aldehydirespiratoraceae bacterium]